MGEYVVMLICELLCPLTMLLLGLFLWRFPAEYRSIWGYHTTAAESSHEAWAAAQVYFGIRMVIAQIPVIVIMVVSWVISCVILKLSEDAVAAIAMVITAVPMIVVFIVVGMTERMLKKYFGKQEKRDGR